MNCKIKWRKFSTTLILVLLISACSRFYEVFPSPSVFKLGDPTATPLGNDITDPNFIKGVDAFKAKNYQEVLNLMSAVIEADPNLAPPYRYRGAAYLSLGDCQSGLADEEKALSINPNYAAAFGARGALYGCLGDHEQELQDYHKALSIDASLAFVHKNLGVYYFDKGDYEKSLEEYNLSVAIDPYRADAWSGKSEALGRLGRLVECIQSATKAIDLNPKEWLAYSDRGVCELNINNFTAAEADYIVYLAHYPYDVSGWINLGYSQMQLAKPEEAVNSFDRALEINPSTYPAYVNRGNALISLGEYEKALDDFNQALEFGDIPKAYIGRGTAYYWLEQYDEAIADLELATQKMPDSPSSHCMLALTYLEVRRYQDSLDAAATANQIQPGYGGQRLLEAQARSYYALGNYKEALSYINKAIEINDYVTGYYTGYYYRGIIYQTTGRNEEAVSDLERFLLLTQDTNDFKVEVANAKERLAELKP